MKSFNNKGFTLIELLVVIAIIGLLSTLSVIALNSAREKARNARRVSDMKQIQTALELYFNDVYRYPASTDIDFTATGEIATGSGATKKVYMSVVPRNPMPKNDSPCTDQEYTYTRDLSNSYHIYYCISENTGGISAGINFATPAGISD